MSVLAVGSQNRSMRRANTLLPLAAAVALCLSVGAHAASVVVNDASAGSVANPPGKCTLFDAVSAINTRAAVNGCAAGDGVADTIDLTGFTALTTITFTQATSGFTHALALNQPVTIKGALDRGNIPLVTLERSTVSGTPDFGLIESTAVLTVYGLALSNGSAPAGGGAILAGSDLTVNSSVIANNRSGSAGGGIAGSGSVTLNHSTVSGNSAANMGGGISSSASVHVYNSALSGNSTTSASGVGGAGIYSSGSVLAGNSTISNNTSATDGGGINTNNSVTLIASTLSSNAAQGGAGGAVFAINAVNANGSVSATASTINGNSASTNGGGIDANDAALTNSTITGNTVNGSGGGIFAGTVTLNYCTVVANTAQFGMGGGIDFGTGGTADATILFGNTPRDVNSASALAGSFDIIANSTSAVPVDTISCDPVLAPLGDFGGPTQTMALMNGSCALDAASASPSVTVDQRGFARPAVGESHFRADIGAFERQVLDDPGLIFANGFE